MASKKHPKVKPFKNKSFPLFDDIGDLVDGTRATGKYVFWGSQSPTQSNESTLAPIVKMRPIRKPLITEDTRGLQRRI